MTFEDGCVLTDSPVDVGGAVVDVDVQRRVRRDQTVDRFDRSNHFLLVYVTAFL